MILCATTGKECGKWLISMHSSISWQHSLINAKLKLLCLRLSATAIKCAAELQKLPHQQDQHPDEVTRRTHIYRADVELL